MATTNGGAIKVELGLPDDFVHLQSTLTINRRARPPIVEIPSENEENARLPLREPLKELKIERRASRGGLRSLFTRNKIDKMSTSPLLEEDNPVSALPERTIRAVAGASIKRSLSLRRNGTGAETPATPIRPNSRMRIMTTKTPSKPSPKSTKSPGRSSNRAPTRTSTAWDPPPLFQAYPQAIKHAQLSASTLSADSILRINNHQKNNSLRDEIASARMGNAVDPNLAKKASKTKSKHRRQISGSMSKAEWTQKIFVLVTSGYLLQYAGEGSFDRLPEKMMQLGKDSVAFASDVIPGKHWVLQISQAMDSDGTPAADSRSFLSRLAFRGADYRRSATSLLLVFNSPEDMDQWLAVVRREIEALGGKKHVSETGKARPDDKIMKLEAQPSHRYQVTRDPDQASSPPSPRLPEFGPPPWAQERVDDIHQKLEEAVNAWTSPQLPLFTTSTGENSVTNSVVSHTEQQLDNLRDGSNRFSYMSSGQRTMVTSEGSTPTTSPTRATTPGFDEIPSMLDFKFPIEEATARPNASAINERRRSMQTIRIPTIDVPTPPKHYRHSTYVGTARNIRINPAGTPNFSVPNSSSKRWSAQKISIPEKTPVSAYAPAPRARESLLKGMQKTEDLDVKNYRPLSPVKDLSPKTTDAVESVSKAPEVNLPALPILPSKPEAEATIPSRRSSLMPLPLARKLNSMQILRETKSHQELREASVPPQDLPPLPSTPEYPRKDYRSSRGSTISPIPAVANTKSKIRRPFSLQVSATPFTRAPASIKSPIKPTTPPGGLTLFPTMKQALGRSGSPAFNEDGGILTAVTILSPTEAKPKSPYLSHDARSNSSTFLQKPISPYLNQDGASHSSPSLPKQRVPLISNESRGSLTAVTSLSHSMEKPQSPPVRKQNVRMPPAALSPTIQALKGEESPKTLGTRRSLPSLLVNGPPPAPPPECALPPLPPGTCGRGSPIVIRPLRV